MKNNIIYITLIFSVLVLFISCRDDEKIRFDQETSVEKIVNMRIVSSETAFDATKPDASTTLTFYSEDVSNVDEVELMLDHFIFVENRTTDRVSLLTIPGSGITNDGTTEFTFGLTDLTEALGITPEDLAGGDILTIYNFTKMRNGKVYPDTVLAGTPFETINISPTVSQSSNTTSFTTTLSYPIVCELPEGFATGEYMLEVIEGANTGFGVPIFDEGVVNLTATSNTGRTFNAGYFSAFGFSQDVDFDFACNIVLVPTTDTGLGCPTPTITYVLATTDPGTFDISDDSEFTLNILHNTSGGCGLPVGEKYVLRLTKQ